MSDSENNRPLATSEWFLTIFILGLPLIGVIMHFVWAFGDGNLGRRNFCRATLLWLAIAFGIAALFMMVVLLLGGFAAVFAGAQAAP